MRGKAYAIMNWKDIYAISLSRLNAQEMLMEFAFEHGVDVYNDAIQNGYSHSLAMKWAEETMNEWQIWEFRLV